MIAFYSVDCEGCQGNFALAKVQQLCKDRGERFSERRTVLWTRWEGEANEIMQQNEGLKLPFFYNDENGKALHGYSGTPLMELEKLFDKE